MMTRLQTYFTAVACITVLAVCAQYAEGADPYPLYEIVVANDREAKAVIESGAEAVLRGDHSYLIAASDEVVETLSRNGIHCRLVLPDFDRDEWAILMHKDPSIDLEDFAIGLAGSEQFRFGDYLIARKEAALRCAVPGSGLKSMDFPDFHIPIRFAPDRTGYVSPFQPPFVDYLLSLISKDSLEAYVRRLEEFATRYSYSDSVIAARDWLVGKFEQFGYDAVVDSFYQAGPAPYGGYMFNVVADHTGTAAPDVLIILCGHYDSVSSDPYVAAPGADDNATGTAFCLEIARVLKGFETAKTVRFICFSGEEQYLLGSRAYVRDNPDLNIEVVINADMIGTAINNPDLVKIFQNPEAVPHGDYCRATLLDYTSVTGLNSGNASASDHVPFQQAGYRAMFVHEYDFSPHYHKTHDLADYLDFDYMTEIVRGFAAATYKIALAPPFVEGISVAELGKGDRLLVQWDSPVDSRDFYFEIRYWSVPEYDEGTKYVGKDVNSVVLDGLTEGLLYYMTVTAIIDGLNESVASSLVSGTPRSVPCPATNLTASTAFKAVELAWERSIHPDVVGYEVFRSMEDDNHFVHMVTVDGDRWTDSSALGGHRYSYLVVAVDEDSLRSEASDTAIGQGAFFDRELLVVINPPGGTVTDTSTAFSRYREILCGIRYDLLIIDDRPVSAGELGQYRSVIWINDGYARLPASLSTIEWVSSFGTNLFMCGPYLADRLGDYSYDWFGLNNVARSRILNFVSASGEDGWPDVHLDTSVTSRFNGRGQSPYLKAVSYYDHDPAVSTAIYRYQSSDTLYEAHNLACGVTAEIDSSRFVLLSFPIFHLDRASGRAIIDHVADMFGIPRDVAGDINGDRRRSLSDCVLMLKMLYLDHPLPADANCLDVNGDCEFDLRDVIYLLGYMYLGGAEPVCGCLQPY